MLKVDLVLLKFVGVIGFICYMFYVNVYMYDAILHFTIYVLYRYRTPCHRCRFRMDGLQLALESIAVWLPSVVAVGD